MPSGDRRELVRFDVTGELWVSFELRKDAILRNIGDGGICVEVATATAPPGELAARGFKPNQVAQISFGDRGSVSVVVRHVSPVAAGTSEDRQCLGLEFVNVSASDRAALEVFLRARQEDPDLS